MKNQPIVFLMILDHVRADILYRLIHTNRMPYLKKYIFNRAAVVENCFTSFPTNTMPGHIALLTGTYADKHHIHAMKFWNLSKMRYRDYSGLEIFNLLQDEFNPQVKMIYEFFQNSEAFTASNFAKGAKYTYLTKMRTIFYYLLQKITYKPILIQSLKTFLSHFRKNLSNQLSDMLYVLWLPISDLIGHELGPTSSKFTQHLEEIDHILFKTLFEGHKSWKGLKKLGLLESTYFVITADHGGFPVQFESELIQDLKPIPLQIKNSQTSIKNLNKYDLLVAYTDGLANIYVKNPSSKNWNVKVKYSQIIAYPTVKGPINLINEILKIPTVSHIFVRNNELDIPTYVVFSREGTSQIQRKFENQKPIISYQVLSGTDPLGYAEKPNANQLMDGKLHLFDEWLPFLCETNYPMVIDQIPRIFKCETAGDIVFMGKEGHSFSKEGKKGTHDTGTFICTRVPLIMAGPSIKNVTIPIARTVDIVPTLLHLLNKTPDFSQFDGRILSEIIQS